MDRLIVLNLASMDLHGPISCFFFFRVMGRRPPGQQPFIHSISKTDP
uniref:Uncharacterized protein n=1 Tax=Picea sitchensis TaxID=3332 RepID=B8LQ90_PICSI|nr:unknown [Picea sitchensis]